VIGSDVDQKMPRRVEREGSASEPMRLGVVDTGGEPAGEHAEIG
jgi:hypothetical protein